MLSDTQTEGAVTELPSVQSNSWLFCYKYDLQNTYYDGPQI